jgi:MoaA/NifB/PqqE/SkfB family radical SAM enzyme
MGVKSITITGGGEPLMYPQIDQLIAGAILSGIKVGLVTNGLLLGNLDGETLGGLTWCRVSFSDERKTEGLEDIIKKAVKSAPDVDWAFSYVVTRDYDKEKLSFIIDLANRLGFTHVRVVSDLIDIDGSEPMDKVRESLAVDDSRVIYQPRQEYTRGSNPCYISLLKPVFGADGRIYPCCGAQYAIDGAKLDLISQMQMGDITDFPSLVSDQMFFDGSVCDRCYYSEYNKALDEMLSPIKHIEFV